MERLTIGEVARRAGIRTSALRYYESLGLIPEPARVSGHRRYEASVLHRLALIRQAQQAGFTLPEIAKLLNAFPTDTPASQRWQAVVPQKLAEVEAQIQRAQSMKRQLQRMQDCCCPSLDECAQGISESSAG